jgi:hypothetical protein
MLWDKSLVRQSPSELSLWHEALQKLTIRWGSRLQIFFTDSVPIMSVDPKAVTVIPDVVSSSASNPANPATEEILTDGCGLMCKLRTRLPSAYQADI